MLQKCNIVLIMLMENTHLSILEPSTAYFDWYLFFVYRLSSRYRQYRSNDKLWYNSDHLNFNTDFGGYSLVSEASSTQP